MTYQSAILLVYLIVLSFIFPDNTLRILVALDIFLFAVVTLGRSKRNETASSAAWSSAQDGRILGLLFRPLIDGLFYFVERDHCRTSWMNENPEIAK